MSALLEVSGLSVALERGGRTVPALDGVNFSVGEGETLGLVGESGAGKSITGAAIADLLTPPLRRTGGEITLAGERLDLLAPGEMARRRGRAVGFVFQDPLTSLNPVLTVGRHFTDVMMGHTGISAAEARARAVDWIARIGLPAPESRLAQYPHELSGGMRQRIVIALALCCGPRLVIADEPTTALDVSVQAHVLGLLRDLHAQSGAALLLITHDLGVMAKMADRIAVLYAGRIVETGSAAQVLGAPRHPYTRGLLRATPSHRVKARPEPIPGAMPRLGALPSGCAFHPRCAYAADICRAARPGLEAQPGGGAAACWRPLSAEAA